MINASSAFQKKLADGDGNFLKYADILLQNGTTLHLTNEHIWQGGLQYEDAVSSDSDFQVGAAIINKANLTINNIYNDFGSYDFDGATVTTYIGYQMGNNTVERHKKGTYTVDETSYNGSLIELECLDNMSKFDKAFSTQALTVPNTVHGLINACCLQCNVTLATVTFPHYEFVINNLPDSETTTYREIIAWLAQLCGCFARCNPDGELEIKWYDQTGLTNALAAIDGGIYSPWTEGDSLDGGSYNPWTEGDSAGGATFGAFNDVHFIYKTYSHSVSTDDVIITGVQITIKEDEQENGNVEKTYTAGTTGYTIAISGNPFITKTNVGDIVQWLGAQLIGFKFRKANVSHTQNPTIEAGDVAILWDRHGNRYPIVISRTNYTSGSPQSTISAAQTPAKNTAQRFSADSKNFVELSKKLKQQKSAFEQAQEQLAQALSVKAGLYSTVESTQSGNIYYLHDQPDLEDSNVVWKMTNEAFGVTTHYDGDSTVWNGGMTVNGDVIARILTAIGVNADWINSGAISISKTVSGQPVEVFYADVDTGAVRIKADSFSLSTGETLASTLASANSYANGVGTSTLASANAYTDSLNTSLNQSAIFNRLTNNGALQGIFMDNGELYINMSYLRSGAISIGKTVGGTFHETFYASSDGTVRIVADSFSLSSGATLASTLTSAQNYADGVGSSTLSSAESYADGVGTSTLSSAEAYTDTLDSSLNQAEVFKRLTNNQANQGIYIENGNLYINASMIGAGTISADRIGANSITAGKLNVSSLSAISADLGTITAGSINITGSGTGAGTITLNNGSLTATNVNLTGAITATSGSFTGSINATSGTFSGTISAGTYLGLPNTGMQVTQGGGLSGGGLSIETTGISASTSGGASFNLTNGGAMTVTGGSYTGSVQNGSSIGALPVISTGLSYTSGSNTMSFTTGGLSMGGGVSLGVDGTGKISNILVGANAIYSAGHTAYDSATRGFYLGSSGSFGVGDDTNYIHFDSVNGRLDMRVTSFSLQGSSIDDIAQAKATAAYNSAKDYTDGEISRLPTPATLNQENVFNALTNNRQNQGIYLSNGDVYINATMIGTGTLDAGRINAGSIDATKLNISTLDSISNMMSGIHIESNKIYSGSHSTYSASSPGFYLGSDGSFGVGSGTKYVHFDASNGRVDMKVDSLEISGSTVSSIIDNSWTTNFTQNSVISKLVGTTTNPGIYLENGQLKIIANSIAVANLAAISADMGAITAGSITLGSGTRSCTIESNGKLTAVGASFDGSIIARDGYFHGVFQVGELLNAGDIYGGQANFYCDVAAYSFKKRNNDGTYTAVSLDGHTHSGYAASSHTHGFSDLTGVAASSHTHTEFNSAIDFKCNTTFFSGYTHAFHGTVKLHNLSSVSSNSIMCFGNDGATVCYTSASSKRYKDIFREMTAEDIEKAFKIQPVIAKYKDGYLAKDDERNGVSYPMFIAEDVEKYIPEAADHRDGKTEDWNTRVMIPVMFQMIKSLKAEIAELKSTGR